MGPLTLSQGSSCSPKLGDVLLLFVVDKDLPGGAGQRQRVLAMVRHAVAKTLGVLVGRELAGLQHAVQAVPRPWRSKLKCWGGKVEELSKLVA